MARTILSCLGLGLAAVAAGGANAGLSGAASPEVVALAAALGGVAGNFTTDLFKVLYRPAAERWLEGRSAIAENHVVASALRLAQLKALGIVRDRFDTTWLPSGDRVSRHAASRFSYALKDFLEAETKTAEQAGFDADRDRTADEQTLRDAVLKELPDLFDDSLAARRAAKDQTAIQESLAQVRAALEKAVLAEICLRTATSTEDLPDAFLQAFNGSYYPESWFDLFVRDAAFRLTQNADFARIWTNEQIAIVKARVEAQSALLTVIDDRIMGNEVRADERQSELLAAIAGLGIPLPALRGIVAGFGEQADTLGPPQIEARLRAKADEYRALKDRLDRLTNDDPRVANLRGEARVLIDAGRFEKADATLAEAVRLDLEAVAEQEAMAARRRLSAAESSADRGAAARLRLAYREAAAHYAAAADIVPGSDPRARWGYLLEKASALGDQGREFGDNAALCDAIDVYRSALILAPRDRVPLDWAATQTNLGTALLTLGGRESGTARLEEAVSAFRAALEERTRERVPLDWAAAQDYLGVAFLRLWEHDRRATSLKEISLAVRAVPEEWTRERVTRNWATMQNDFNAMALKTWEGDRGKTHLLVALSAFRAALEERTRERVPLDWAATQNNIGITFLSRGDFDSGSEHLEQAVSAFRAALEERTRERVPLDWAATQHNLGTALFKLGTRERGTARLEEALSAFRAALEERTRERVPLDWAATQTNLGIASMRLWERERGMTRLEEAVSAFLAALEEQTRERVPLDWAATQNELGIALSRLAVFESGTARLQESLSAFTNCLQVAEAYWSAREAQEVRAARDAATTEIIRRNSE